MFTHRFFLGAISAILLLARTSCGFTGWTHSSQHNHVNRSTKKTHPSFHQTNPAKHPIGLVLHSRAPEIHRASLRSPFRQNNVLQRVAYKFIHFLWKGITLPFPMLRGIAKESTETGLTLGEIFMAMGAYLGAGVLAYSVVLEKWSIVDACYFSVVSWSTVGYGDLSPSTAASKLFTCIYGLGGVCLLGAAISSLGSRLVNAEIESIKSAERLSRRRLLKVLDFMPGVMSNKQIDQDESDQITREESTTSPWWTQKLLRTAKSLIPAFTVLITGGLIMGRMEGWNWTDGLYYSVITAGTLGFGDFSPRTRAGRILAIPFIPFAVAASGEVIGNVASFLSERRAKQVYDRILHRELTMDYLLQMDANGDGKVTREEFICGMLVELKLVDVDQLEQLNQQFDRLDITKSGTLDKEDLKIAALQSSIQTRVYSERKN